MKRYHLLILFLLILSSLLPFILEDDDLYLDKKTIWSFEENKSYLYNINYEVKGKTNVNDFIKNNSLNSQNFSWEEINTKLEGQFSLQVLQNNKSCSKVFLNWESISGVVTHKNQILWKKNNTDQIINFFFTLCEDGEFKELVFNNSSDAITRGVMKTILSLVQIKLPLEKQNEWQSQENFVDHQGLVKYKVNKIDERNMLTISKTILADNTKVKSKGLFQLDFPKFGGAITSVKGTRHKESYLESAKIGIEDTSIELKLISINKLEKLSSQANNSVKDSDYKFVTNGLSAKEEFKSMKRTQQIKLIENESTYDLLEGLESDTKNHKIMEKLEAMLIIKPEEAERVASALSIADFNDSIFHRMASLLSRVGTPESQKALIEVMRGKEELSDKSLLYLVPYLGHSKNPLAESEAYLKELSQNSNIDGSTAKTADLALGTMSRNLNEEYYDRSTKIYSEMSKKLESSSEPKTQEHYLRVLGNIGHEAQVDILRQYIKDNHQLKNEALNALRNVNTDESRDILINEIKSTTDNKTKLISLKSLSHSDGNHHTLSLYKDIIKEEKNIYIVIAAIDNLSSMAKNFPEALEILKNFQNNCSTLELCEKVNTVLLSEK